MIASLDSMAKEKLNTERNPFIHFRTFRGFFVKFAKFYTREILFKQKLIPAKKKQQMLIIHQILKQSEKECNNIHTK